MYDKCHLDCLKACFYEQLEDSDQRLNIGLNVFFGNEPQDNEKWIESFKEKIIELTVKRSESEKVTITRKEISLKTLTNFDPKNIIKEGRKKWDDIKNSLNQFLINLKTELTNEELRQTLIYEAPPFKITYNPDEDNEPIKFVAKFIFEESCPSAYAQSIKDWAENKNDNPSIILAKKKTGFFDIIPIPIPINSELRTLWAIDKEFLIGGKRIFIHFFEWAVEDYLKRLKTSDIQVSDDHKVAIGVPLNNAVTLYEYYESQKSEGKGLLKELLTPNNFKLKNEIYNGTWLQHYKSSIISPGNKPLGKLIENAFS
ncbi:MAG: hypothetical protein FJX80_11755 [Bacteroidetes bacterium]|nr:hypothetical protein [Bacteroidota bacterium]